MRHKLQIIKPYKLKDMIIVVEDFDMDKSLWYLYDMSGNLIKRGYGRKAYTERVTASQQAFANANQVARRFIRKNIPLLFGRM